MLDGGLLVLVQRVQGRSDPLRELLELFLALKDERPLQKWLLE